MVDYSSGCVRFESLDLLAQVICRRDEVQVVFQDDIAKQSQAPFILQETPRIKNDLNRFRTCEHRQPAGNGVGQKMR